MRRVTLLLLFVFSALLAAGIFWDEPARVLNLSTQICLPCIGIG